MKTIYAYNPTMKPFGLYSKTNESLDMVFETYEDAKEQPYHYKNLEDMKGALINEIQEKKKTPNPRGGNHEHSRVYPTSPIHTFNDINSTILREVPKCIK